MKKRFYLLILTCLSIISYILNGQSLDRQRFMLPENEDRPWVYWYWLNGNINEKGLMADLESMKEAGIGTAMVFDIGIGVTGKTLVRSNEWYDLMRKVILKADELGLRLGFNCPGWANSGGPWITPELSMKELTWSQAFVNNSDGQVKLPQPPGRLDFYRDIAVFAFPTIDNDEVNLTADNCKITDTDGNPVESWEKLFDNDRDTYEKLPGTFEIVLENPATIRSLEVRASSQGGSRFFVANFWMFDENKQEFVLVKHINGVPSGLNDRPGMGTSSFEPVTGKRFRLGFMTGYANTTQYSNEVYLQELNLCGGYRLPDWNNKTGFGNYGFDRNNVVAATHLDMVDPEKIINLTSKMKPDGTLDWKVPEGQWTVVRLGYIPTGAQSQPLNRGLTSLESDKYNTKAAKVQYDSIMIPLLELAGRDVAARVFSNYHIDSYEVGWQNWSESLPDEFFNRRGYRLEDYFVTLTGRVVGSLDKTERFLWDFRRTMADCYAVNHIGYFAERAKQDGMIFSSEAYDGPFEDLQAGGHTDMPMTEIWQNSPPDSRPRSGAMFAGHTYGRKLIGSEQYTGMGHWDQHPWRFKGLADASMSYGVNTFVMHVFTQQPWTDRRFTPGATLGPWGAHYDRANTWFHESRPWHDYISRCQYMLRIGQPVADILYFMGDNAPSGGGNSPVNPPYGYDGDALNGEILQQIVMDGGMFVLPSGKRYKYLMMPAHGEMTLSSLKKIAKLVREGATIAGTRPVRSNSMADTGMETEYRKLAAEIFDEVNVRSFEGKKVEEIIAIDNYKPDFSSSNAGLNIKYCHRQDDDMDIYFVSNVSETVSGKTVCSFRLDGVNPEVWDPMTGNVSLPASFAVGNGMMYIPLDFKVGETKFIVFKKMADMRLNVESVKYDGADLLRADTGHIDFQLTMDGKGKYHLLTDRNGEYTVKFDNGSLKKMKVKDAGKQIALNGHWAITFEKRLLSPLPEKTEVSGDKATVYFDRLQDWSKSEEEGIKYYSGTADYATTFTVKSIQKNDRYMLDLGDVQVIAHVYVNGHDMGTLWKPPYKLDITEQVGKGINKLVIAVTNLWPNRLIGDEQFPDDVSPNGNWTAGELWQYPDWVWNEGERPDKRRVSFTTYKHWKKDAPLLSSGLIGPVKITTMKKITF